jgi:hypothetical protein
MKLRFYNLPMLLAELLLFGVIVIVVVVGKLVPGQLAAPAAPPLR